MSRAGEDTHPETHASGRAGWLRAAVLGANDGIVSVASLMVGLGAAGASAGTIAAGGVAALSAGAMSMAVGEYVSVSSQADVERGDRAIEARELSDDPDAELAELAAIYVERGLEPELAAQVATALHRADPLAAHMRDELGYTESTAARPLQAALASAASFLVGGALPLLGVLAPSAQARVWVVVAITLLALGVAGVLAARAAATPVLRPALRVLAGGVLAMAITAAVGQLAHVSAI
ncbi:VIT family protein [Nocardioides marinquilinus]